MRTFDAVEIRNTPGWTGGPMAAGPPVGHVPVGARPAGPARGARAEPWPDEVAFLVAYEHVRPGLLRWLGSRTHDEARAEDCCEEAFLRLLCQIRAGRAPDLPAAWLFQVAHNLLVSEARHQRVVERETAGSRSPSVDHGADPVSDAVVERERVAEVSRALARLEAGDREVVLLAARGASAEELGAALGISAVAARTRLYRARRRLDHGLGDAP